MFFSVDKPYNARSNAGNRLKLHARGKLNSHEKLILVLCYFIGCIGMHSFLKDNKLMEENGLQGGYRDI